MTWRSTCNYFKLFLFFVPSILISVSLFAQNPIVTENALSGTPYAEWGVPDFRDNRIAGFATKMSLNRGETVRFKINVQGAASFSMKIYRIGYYGGNGARLKHDFGTLPGTIQPAGISDPVTGILDCSNWSESASWAIPSNAVSGLYVAKMERVGGGSNHIVFIVRNDASTSDIYFQLPDATWQAYNGYGGNSLYDGTTGYPGGHAVKVSYNRPFFPYNSAFNTDGRGADWYMNSEYPMIRWLERNGYNVTYTSSNDVANNGSRLLNHKIFMTNGHDEYWSKEQRNNVEAARNAGVHLAFFTGNEVYWKTRWESLSGSEHRTLVCYKEGLLGDGTAGERTCGGKCDGSTSEWTGLWRTGGNYDAGKPENALVGQISWVEYPAEIGVPAFYKKLRFWRNSAVANLSSGQTAFLGQQTLGYEWDYEQYPDSYPSGRITMSSRTINSLTHKLSLYRHSSGALVFGAGTVQWSWGLDGNHWGGSTTVSPEMQQATVNLFADMGVQPGSLQSGLVPASASTDATAPTTTLTAPSNGATFASGATINITGTATDGGGGVVAGVEVSLDGGNTWKPATLNTIDGNVNWSYSWVTTSNGTFNIRFRSFDDSGNMGTAGPGINVNVGGPDVTPPTVTSISPLNGSTGISTGTTVVANFSETINSSTVTSSSFQLKNGSNVVAGTFNFTSNQVTLVPSAVLSTATLYTVTIKGGSSGVKDIAGNPLASDYTWTFTTGAGGSGSSSTVFQPTDVPANPLANDGMAISLGMRFRSTQNGFITGIRYYKGAGATGTHTGHLWTNNGTQLAQVTFSNETASGWQQAFFSSPVAITAGVTYVASYFSPSGQYAATKPYFTQAVVNGPLRGLADGEDGPNGLYQYSPSAVFPGNSFQSSNYWVDVVFTTSGGADVTAPTVTSVSPLSGATAVGTSTTVVANFSEAVNASTVTGSTFQLRGPGSTLVTATVSTVSNQITLTPSAALAASTTYTATITGGSSGVKDLAGNALASNFVWSFTTAAASDVTPPTVTSVSPLSGATGVSTGTTVQANFSEALNVSTVTGSTFQLRDAGNNLVPASVSGASNQITLIPSVALAASTTYTATITGGASGVKDLAGNALASNFTWSFTTAASSGGTGLNILPQNIVPESPRSNDGTGIALGVRFSSSENGTITGVRYYKGPGTTGTHTGQLWTNSGTLLAQATFTNETATGWQTAFFTTPVTITANTIYVASYHSPSGDFAATINFYTQAVVNGPLRGLANGESGPNGLYRYTSSPAFPNNGYQSSNYWADVVFVPAATGVAPVVTLQPQSQVVCDNTQVNFSSTATGTPAPTVQWQESTNGTSWTNVSGATSGTYTLTATSALNNRQYRAQWTNSAGTTNSSAATLTVNAIPGAPLVSVTNNCGSSILTASGYTGSLLWSTGATTASITVTNAGTYTVTQTVNGCTSAPGSGVAAPNNTPVPTPVVTVTNNCGNAVLTASGFTGSLLWSTGATTPSITVTDPGTYTVTQTINGCTSAEGSGVAAPKAIPVAPTVTVTDNCTNSVLTASNFSGSLLWSNGATSPLITVTVAGTYTVTQTVNGCTSTTGSGVASPKPIPPAPTVTVVNNCGNSVLTAGNFTGSLLWSNGATSPSITVTVPGTYTVTQTINGCTSASGSGVAAPNSSEVPAPVVTVTDNCGSSLLTASGFTGSLLWSTGATSPSITVTTAGIYTVTQTVNGCSSPAGGGLANPKAIPSTPTVTVTDNCTNSVLTAENFTGSLLWSTGAITPSITVTTAGTYTVQQIVNGCSSAAGSGTAAPKPIPSAPLVNVVNNCGNSVLTASGHTGNLLWSNGATTPSITVTTAGTYTVTQTVNGCTSQPGAGVAAPLNSSVATPGINVFDSCGYTVLTALNFSGTLLWSTGETDAIIRVPSAGVYTLTQTINGCTSSPASATATPKAIPPAPTVSVTDNCASSILTAGSFTGSLLWSNAATTPSITVTSAGIYTVTQNVNGCTSGAASGTASPKPIPAPPNVSVVNNCGNSVLTASGFTGSLLWSTGATTPSITVASAGQYTVTQTVNGCTSTPGTGTAEPNNTVVPAPVVNVTNNCGSSELTASGFTGTLLWSNGATTPSITVTTGGQYTVTQTLNGCTSTPGIGTAAPKPTPVLTSSLTAAINSGVSFSYTPTSNTAGTSFTWSRAQVNGISNVAANGSGAINETLINATGNSIPVTYVITLTADGCVNTQNLVVTVHPPSDVTCAMTGAVTSSFTNTTIPAGRYIWFNSVIDRGSFSGITGVVNFYITNSKITFTANNQLYTLSVPDAQVTYDPGVLSATTEFVNNKWITIAPWGFTNFVFMTGLGYQVPVNFPGGISNIQWTADIGVNKTGVAISWKWAAAVYTSFGSHGSLNVKPLGGLLQNPYLNTDKAGAPESYKTFVVSGGKGNGGTNYTGNYSSTQNIACTPVSNQRSGPITNAPAQTIFKAGTISDEAIIDELDVTVMPNPTRHIFNVIIKGNPKELASVRVFDIFGQLLERHEKIFPGELSRLGQTWKNGTYILEVIQGSQRKVVKIIKAD